MHYCDVTNTNHVDTATQDRVVEPLSSTIVNHTVDITLHVQCICGHEHNPVSGKSLRATVLYLLQALPHIIIPLLCKHPQQIRGPL